MWQSFYNANSHHTIIEYLVHYREIEVINEREKRKENFMYLMVEFPRVVHKDLEYAIVYFEKDGDETTQACNRL